MSGVDFVRMCRFCLQLSSLSADVQFVVYRICRHLSNLSASIEFVGIYRVHLQLSPVLVTLIGSHVVAGPRTVMRTFFHLHILFYCSLILELHLHLYPALWADNRGERKLGEW